MTKTHTVCCAAVLLAVCCMLAGQARADSNAYHWNGQEQFFEGWYFKVSDPVSRKSFLFIYAVLNPDGGSPHSQGFMMAGNNSPGSAHSVFQSFPVDEFSSEYDRFDTRIGDENRAWGDAGTVHFEGSISDGEHTCSWNIQMTISEAWTDTMGWMENLSDLQTYWYVHAMKAGATGWIRWDDDYFAFEDCIGYHEKNWGDEFPESWYWLQANHFDDPDACCISVGGATMPIGPFVFNACGIGFRYGGEMFVFSFPQTAARIIPVIEPGAWDIQAFRGRYKIHISAWCDTGDLINLMNPTEQGIVPYTWETLAGSLRVRLYERSGLAWRRIVDTTSDLAGLEFGGAGWLGWQDR